MPRAKKDGEPKRKAARRKAVVVDDVPANKPGATKAIPKRHRRLSVFTADVRAEILGHLKEGLPRYYACRAAGINDTTMRRWMRAGEANLEEIDIAIAGDKPPPDLTPLGEFAYDVMVAEAQSRAIDVKTILAADDWRAQAWYLERMDHRQWGGVSKHQLVAEGVEGEPVDAGALLLDKLNQMAERLVRATGDDEGT